MHMLKDIGISRSDADAEASKPFWKGIGQCGFLFIRLTRLLSTESAVFRESAASRSDDIPGFRDSLLQAIAAEIIAKRFCSDG